MKRLTKQKIKEIKQFYKEGKTRADIARTMGINYASVCYHLPRAHRKTRVKALRVTESDNRYKELVFSLIEQGVLKLVKA